MKNVYMVAAVVTGMVAASAQAQESAFTGQDAAADQIDEINETIVESAERTALGSGHSGRPMGWDGSVSLLTSATSGNTDTFDFGMGARMGYFDGTNGHRFNTAIVYGEQNGITNKNDSKVSYDYTREMRNGMYGYGQMNLSFSEFGAYEEDHFLGFGLGVHAVSTATTQWSLQTGPGYRVAKTQAGTEIDQEAWSLSSRYTHALSDTASLFNDTDVIYSDIDTAVTNEAGISVSLSNALALRTSLTTEYHSNPAPGMKDTDNKLGMSIVYNFK